MSGGHPWVCFEEQDSLGLAFDLTWKADAFRIRDQGNICLMLLSE